MTYSRVPREQDGAPEVSDVSSPLNSGTKADIFEGSDRER
jgi:hypothetical protein